MLAGERYSCDCEVVTRVPCEVGLMFDDEGDVSSSVTCRAGTEVRLVHDLQACAPALMANPEAFCAQACSELTPRIESLRGVVVRATLIDGGRANHIGAGECESGSEGTYVFPSLTDEDTRRGRIERAFSSMDVSIETEGIDGTATGVFVEDTRISIKGARCSDPRSLVNDCLMTLESFEVLAGFEDPSDGPYPSVPFTVDGAVVRNFSLRLSDQLQGRMQTAESLLTPHDEWDSRPSTSGSPPILDTMNLELGANIFKDGVGPMGMGTVEINIMPDGESAGHGETIAWPDPGGEIETQVTSPAQFMTFVGSFSDTRDVDGTSVTFGISLNLLAKFFAGSPRVDFSFIRERRPPPMMSMSAPSLDAALPASQPSPEPGAQPAQDDEPAASLTGQTTGTVESMTTLSLVGTMPYVIIDGTPTEPWPGVPIVAYRWYYREHDPVAGTQRLLVGIGPRLQVPEHVFDAVLLDPDRDLCMLAWGADGLRSESCIVPGDPVFEEPPPVRLDCAELAAALPLSLGFQEALDALGAPVVPGGNGITWFVPTDDAIDAEIGRPAFDAMLAAPDGVELQRFVLSHAYDGIVPIASVGTALAGAPSLAGDPGDLTAPQKQAAIYDGDAPCLNGVVHGVDYLFARPAP